MNTYFIPRNTKGEGKIFYIFSIKALIYTVIGIVIGAIFYFILNMFGIGIVGLVVMGIFALLGFIIGTFKIPDTTGLEITRKAGGQSIDEIIVRYFKFKMNKKKIYIYKQEGTKDE